MARHCRIVQDAVQDLQLGDGLAGRGLNPAIPAFVKRRQFLRHPAVSFTEDADEKRAALVDLVEAEVEHAVVLGLFPRHAPAQVDIHQMNPILLQPRTQLGERHLNKVIALGVHIAEGRGDEDFDRLPQLGHATLDNRTPFGAVVR